MELEICMSKPGKVMEIRKICLGHGISDFSLSLSLADGFNIKKYWKLCVKCQNILAVLHFAHCQLSILRP